MSHRSSPKLGREPTLTHHQRREALKRIKAGDESHAEIARGNDRLLGCSKQFSPRQT
jgi:hypothetical protein